MFYPNHYIRTYCIYLASIELQNQKYDMGVYIHPDKSVSHAIVCGNEDSEYISGLFIFKGVPEPKEFCFQSLLPKINMELYKNYLNNPSNYPQPEIFKQQLTNNNLKEKPMTVKDLITYLESFPQDIQVIYNIYSEQVLLKAEELKLVECCIPRPDGWVHDKRPDKPTQLYLCFPGN